MALGIGPDSTFHQAPEVQLQTGDLVLLVTDGVIEARSPQGEVFGIDRALDYVREHQQQPARLIVEGLYTEVRCWEAGRPQGDDITIVVVKVEE
jgi:sigma-B regulation protein RsbU (phosphoserine phosphatase)